MNKLFFLILILPIFFHAAVVYAWMPFSGKYLFSEGRDRVIVIEEELFTLEVVYSGYANPFKVDYMGPKLIIDYDESKLEINRLNLKQGADITNVIYLNGSKYTCNTQKLQTNRYECEINFNKKYLPDRFLKIVNWGYFPLAILAAYYVNRKIYNKK